MRDGVQADMTALGSTNVSTIFWIQSASASALTSNTSTPRFSSSATVPATNSAPSTASWV